MQGIMTVNGRNYTNNLTKWGIASLFKAMFENIELPDLYLAVCGRSQSITHYPGEPNPYLNEQSPDTVGEWIRNIPGVFEYFNFDALGNRLDGGQLTIIDGAPRSFFEFTQNTPLRLKLSPFNIDGLRIGSDTFEFSCPEVPIVGVNPGEMVVFLVVDSPTQFNNSSHVFSYFTLIDVNLTAGAGGSTTSANLTDGATFAYSFDLN